MATDGVKKAKAAAKPSKTATKKAKTPAASTQPVAVPTHEEIAALAQRYWVERGCHEGMAEQDWLRAEQNLLGKAS